MGASSVRYFRHIQLRGDPETDLGPAEEIKPLRWLALGLALEELEKVTGNRGLGIKAQIGRNY